MKLNVSLFVAVLMTVVNASQKDGKDFVPPALSSHMLFQFVEDYFTVVNKFKNRRYARIIKR